MPPIAALAVSAAEALRSPTSPAQVVLALLPGIQPVATDLYLTVPPLMSTMLAHCVRQTGGQTGALPLPPGMWFWGVCLALAARTLVRRHGDTHGH